MIHMMASGTVIGTPELDWSVTAARDVPAGARTDLVAGWASKIQLRR